MSSFFSAKSRSQAQRNPSSSKDSGQSGHVGGETRISESKPAVSKMRDKRRPPPITISLENGNVILASGTPTSQIIYADSPWSPTTPTVSNAAARTAPWHHESRTPPSPWPTQVRSPYPWPPDSAGLNPQNPACAPKDWPLPELPGTIFNPNLVELEDVSSAPAVRRDDGPVSEPTPDLTPSDSRDTSSTTLPETDDGSPLSGKARHTGKRSISTTAAQRSDDVLRSSPGNINSCWARALRREGARRLEKRSASKSPVRSRIKQDNLDTFEKKDVKELQADYDLQLKSKDDELSGLLDLHHSRIGTLCNFLLERLPEIHRLNDTAAQKTRDIIKEHQSHKRRQFEPDKLHMSQTQQIRELQSQATHLERRVSRYEKLMKKYRNQVKKLNDDAEQSKRREESLTSELDEKNAQVAVLNEKIVQLLTMDDPGGYPRALFPQPLGEKDLPSPVSCGWKRAGESKQQATTSANSSTHRVGGMIGKLQFEGGGGLSPIY